MVTVTIFKNSIGEYKSVQASGHAGFAESGKDIYCAAVSILMINTLNSIEALTPDQDAMIIEQREEDGFLSCTFNRPLGKEAVLLLDSMVLGMSGIQEQSSGKYTKLRFKEV